MLLLGSAENGPALVMPPRVLELPLLAAIRRAAAAAHAAEMGSERMAAADRPAAAGAAGAMGSVGQAAATAAAARATTRPFRGAGTPLATAAEAESSGQLGAPGARRGSGTGIVLHGRIGEWAAAEAAAEGTLLAPGGGPWGAEGWAGGTPPSFSPAAGGAAPGQGHLMSVAAGGMPGLGAGGPHGPAGSGPERKASGLSSGAGPDSESMQLPTRGSYASGVIAHPRSSVYEHSRATSQATSATASSFLSGSAASLPAAPGRPPHALDGAAAAGVAPGVAQRARLSTGAISDTEHSGNHAQAAAAAAAATPAATAGREAQRAEAAAKLPLIEVLLRGLSDAQAQQLEGVLSLVRLLQCHQGVKPIVEYY